MRETRKSHDWEKLLAHAAMLQAKVPAAVLVGGTAAALHAGHRISFDHDHVLKDLALHYQDTWPHSSLLRVGRQRAVFAGNWSWEKLRASRPG